MGKKHKRVMTIAVFKIIFHFNDFSAGFFHTLQRAQQKLIGFKYFYYYMY